MSLLFNVEDFNNVVKEYKLASLYNKSNRLCGDADIDNYVVVNDDLERAIAEVESITKKELEQ